MCKISILPGIRAGYKDKLPEISMLVYRFQPGMWLVINLCRQKSEAD
jgi:hypothetical protein